MVIAERSITDLISAADVEREVILLQQLRDQVAPDLSANKVNNDSEDSTEREWLAIASASANNPFPHTNLIEFINPDELPVFTCYVFDRRYGWSEAVNLPKKQATKFKGTLIEHLSDVIRWYMCQTMSIPLLESLKAAVVAAVKKPVVRNQTIVHCMEWFKLKSAPEISSEYFNLVKDILLLGLTDVWSAIRIACSSRLPAIITRFSLTQLEAIFNDLVSVCQNEASSWQSIEGSLMGINVVVRRFRWVEFDYTNTEVDTIEEESHSLPSFIQANMRTIIYPMLSHPQLSIRESATKVFSSFLSRSQFSEAFKSFKEIIWHLTRHSKIDVNMLEDDVVIEDRPHLGVYGPDFEFMDAYAAEGLFGVCVFLIKHIPSVFLLPNWPFYFSTFALYLTHPASTVRQAASNVFKFLVAKDCNNPVTLEMVLQGLISDWEPSQDCLDSTSQNPCVRRICVSRLKRKSCTNLNLSDTWEWREGRLLAYELILKYLVKNHWLYTFGYAGMTPRLASSDSTCSTIDEVASSDVSPGNSFTKRIVGSNSVSTSSYLKQSNLPRSTMMTGRLSFSSNAAAGPKNTFRSRASSVDFFNSSNSNLIRNRSLKSIGRHRSVIKEVDEDDSKRQNIAAHRATSLLERTRKLQLNASIECAADYISLFKVCETQPLPVPIWMTDFDLQDMNYMLKQILHQTIECLGDGRWELRRMGHQLLPTVVEVIRLYDISVLIELWNIHLTKSPKLLCYGACLSLKHCLAHAAKLLPLIENESSQSFQDFIMFKESGHAFIEKLTSALSLWCDNLHLILCRNECDKLSLVAAEALVLVHCYFARSLSNVKKNEQEEALFSFLEHVFIHAHQETSLAQSLSSLDESFSSPSEGFLSLTHKSGMSGDQVALQAEQNLLSSIHQYLSSFLKSCTLHNCVTILPVLTHLISVYCTEQLECRALFNSILTIVSMVGPVISTSNQSVEVIKQNCNMSLREMAFLVQQKSIDHTLLREILDTYAMLSLHTTAAKHLKPILQAVCVRLASSCSVSGSRENSDLGMLSNDIPVLQVQNSVLQSSSDEEDEGDAKDVGVDSLVLNLSSNSNSLSPHIKSPSSHDEAGMDSDWDSWSDSDDEATLMQLFSEFLGKLKECCSDEFEFSLGQMEPAQREQIRKVMEYWM